MSTEIRPRFRVEDTSACVSEKNEGILLRLLFTGKRFVAFHADGRLTGFPVNRNDRPTEARSEGPLRPRRFVQPAGGMMVTNPLAAAR